MGKVVAVIVGVVAFLVVSLTGNGVNAILFGLVMFGMAYGAFAWSTQDAPDKQNTPNKAEEQTNKERSKDYFASLPPPQADNDSTYGDFPPNVVGDLIARTLDTSCAIDNFSAQEQELLKSAKIPLARYCDETLILAGFSQEYAIHELLQSSPLRDEVLRGYRHAWQAVGNNSPAGGALFGKFMQRCPVYAKAVAKFEAGTISPIAIAFGGFLDESNSDAQLLAFSFADGVFFSHYEGAKYALERAGILK